MSFQMTISGSLQRRCRLLGRMKTIEKAVKIIGDTVGIIMKTVGGITCCCSLMLLQWSLDKRFIYI